MDSIPILIFDLDGARFGVDATRVLESIWLPELTPVEEAPPWIVGVFSLRGRIVPVADLHLRFGHPARPYSPSDRVVVLDTARVPLGVIVNDVIEVIDLARTAIQPPPQFDGAAHGAAHLVAGEARVGDDLVSVLDVAHLTYLPEGPALADAAQLAERQLPLIGADFCSEASDEARAMFRARAMALREAAIEEEGDLLGLAVIKLGGEYFGVELAAVQRILQHHAIELHSLLPVAHPGRHEPARRAADPDRPARRAQPADRRQGRRQGRDRLSRRTGGGDRRG